MRNRKPYWEYETFYERIARVPAIDLLDLWGGIDNTCRSHPSRYKPIVIRTGKVPYNWLISVVRQKYPSLV
jgi:hypothetical protein